MTKFDKNLAIVLVVLIATKLFPNLPIDNIFPRPKPDPLTPSPPDTDLDEIFNFEEPSDQNKNKVKNLINKLKSSGDKDKCLTLAYFYKSFADIFLRDENYIKVSQDFYDYNTVALDLAFNNTSTLGIGSEIDSILQTLISLDPQSPLPKEDVVSLLKAISWAAFFVYKEL